VADINRILKKGKLHFFSIPRLEVMLEHKYTGCLHFEHTVFLTEQFINYILVVNGFSILEKYYFLDNHSIFYACKKIDPIDTSTANKFLPNEYQKNKKLYNEQVKFHLDMINEIHIKMNNYNGEIYLFGGHIFAQYLIAFGLDESKIKCILDNDSNKWGKRLYGTSLIVKSPKILKNIDSATIILRAEPYNQEIKNDIINNINKKIIFWE
jgi:hypothetical protein